VGAIRKSQRHDGQARIHPTKKDADEQCLMTKERNGERRKEPRRGGEGARAQGKGTSPQMTMISNSTNKVVVQPVLP